MGTIRKRSRTARRPSHIGDLYEMPDAETVAAIVDACGIENAFERWGDRMCWDTIVKVAAEGRRGRERPCLVRRGPLQRYHGLARAWDGRAPARIAPASAATALGLPARALDEARNWGIER